MEKFSQIQEILFGTPYTHLADCLDILPEANVVAIDKMITAHKEAGTQKSVCRYQVVQDVAALLDGHISSPLFSQSFLPGAAAPVAECEMCHCTDKPVSTVAIPYSDITKLCKACEDKLPLHGVVNHRIAS